MIRLWALALAALSAAALLADYCPPSSPQSGGMRDEMLAYLGKDSWKQADFLPYVAYLDKAEGGRPKDWFYDSWLFLMFGGAPSGGAYYNGTANKSDWDYYLDLLFSPDQNLAALNSCIEEVGRELGDPDHVCPVTIMIPYLAQGNRDFGEVDGKPVDASADADRERAFRWVVDEVLRRWKPQAYPHLKLWGFYWMMEGVSGPDEGVVRATADYVHSKGYGFQWIPWFSAPDHGKWRDLGFDFTIMQPNFAFMPRVKGEAVRDEDRLSENARICRDKGMGVEMEMDAGIAGDPARRLNLQLYLNHGTDGLDGYMTGAARAYYQSTDLIASLYRSDLPECNRLYGDLYRFHKGTYRRRAVSLCQGAKCTVNGQPEPRLTDGLWTVRAGQEGRTVVVPAPAVAEVDLGAEQFIGDVRVRVVTRPGGDLAAPTRIKVATAAEGGDFEPAVEVACPSLAPAGDLLGGFAIATFQRRLASRVRVEVDAPAGKKVGLEEIVMYPTPHLLWGVEGEVGGKLAAGSAAEAGAALTDGRLARGWRDRAGVRFVARSGRVHLALGDSPLLDGVLAHVWWEGAEAPWCRVATVAAGQVTHKTPRVVAAGHGQAWVRVPLPSVKTDNLTLELSGGGRALWDEVELEQTPDLALGKPYRVSPAFQATYGDTGGVELTDGLLSEKGFLDGRTVGWWDQRVTVTLDLGQPRSIDAVRVQAQGGGYAAVNYPSRIEVWGSQDAEHWRLLGGGKPARQVTGSEEVDGELMELAWLAVDMQPARVRYLRLQFVPQGWLMLSEIEAMSGGEDVARGCTYYLSPGPRSQQKYADDGVRLTDGYCSRPADGWSKAVGWDKGDPEVVVDLLKLQHVSLVRAHVIGGGPGAVWFPKWVRVATSEDGVHWSEETEARPHVAEDGKDVAVAFVDAELKPRQARYIRVRIERSGWVMIDEVEAYGGAG